MLNRQAFSGARLPSIDDPDSDKTVAMWEKANRSIDVGTWASRNIQSLKLTISQPDFDDTVVFEIDDASTIDALPYIKPEFGTITVDQHKPFRFVDGDRRA